MRAPSRHARGVLALATVLLPAMFMLAAHSAPLPAAPVFAKTPRTGTHASAATIAAGHPRAYVAGLKVVSYYPARNGWSRMWTNWDPGTIDADFGRAAALHFNTVRIIVQAWTVGYPTPQPYMQSRLAGAVALAAAHGLKVQLTLFDWWSSYTDIGGSEQWARAILAPYAGDSRIAFIELQNEIDPNNGTAMAWARHMLPYLRRIASGIPVTVSGQTGISGLSALVAALRSSPPDFYSYHYYDSAALAFTKLQQAQQVVAPAPLFIGETGFSSAIDNSVAADNGIPNVPAALEAYQDYYYRAVQNAASQLGLGSVAPWTLNDFQPGSIASVPAGSPEYGFGLYHVDGSAKPIAASVAQYLATGTVNTTFNSGFEQCANGVPAGWQIYRANQGTFSCDSTATHSGAFAAKISQSTGDSSGVPSFTVDPIISGLVAGRTFTASVWARGSNVTGQTRIALCWFGINNQYLGQVGSAPLPAGTTSWTQLSVSASAPAGAAYVQIDLKSAYNTGAVWFDDISFQ